MFSLDIHVEVKTKQGLKALDERRRLGLPDGSVLFENGDKGSFTTFDYSVSETFVRDRSYRFSDKNHITLSIPSSAFKAGELKLDRDMLGTSKDLPEWRLVELWPVNADTFIGLKGITIKETAGRSGNSID